MNFDIPQFKPELETDKLPFDINKYNDVHIHKISNNKNGINY